MRVILVEKSDKFYAPCAMNGMERTSRDRQTVGKVDKIGPTHAAGLKRLVGMNATFRQGEPCSNMGLDFELTCGTTSLRISGNDFELGLRTCFVTLARDNCEIVVGSGYEHWLESGAFKSSETQKQISDRARELGGKLGGEFDSSRASASLFARFGFGVSRNESTRSEALTEMKSRIELIAMSGQDRWRVGDLIKGDARRADSMLSGAYFRELEPHGDPKPLCCLSRVDDTAIVLVSIQVSASFGSLIVIRSSDPRIRPTDDDLRGTRTTLKRRSRRASKEHENVLRAHVAGLVAAKRLREAQIKGGLDVLDNEFLIAQQTLAIPVTNVRE